MGGALRNEISVLIGRDRTGFAAYPCFLPYEDAVRRQKDYKPGICLSPGTASAGTLILDFPASGTMRNECALSRYPVHGIHPMQSTVLDVAGLE